MNPLLRGTAAVYACAAAVGVRVYEQTRIRPFHVATRRRCDSIVSFCARPHRSRTPYYVCQMLFVAMRAEHKIANNRKILFVFTRGVCSRRATAAKFFFELFHPSHNVYVRGKWWEDITGYNEKEREKIRTVRHACVQVRVCRSNCCRWV